MSYSHPGSLLPKSECYGSADTSTGTSDDADRPLCTKSCLSDVLGQFVEMARVGHTRAELVIEGIVPGAV